MAYCKRCGAYIPDGLSACLACGYDETPESGLGDAAAAARERQNEDFRLKYEEERRKRQEENLRWAEEERRRRDEEERRKLEEERRKLEEERKRLEQERLRNGSGSGRGRTYTGSTKNAGYAESRAGVQNASNERGKSRIFSALSYLSMLWVLPYIFRREDPFARYHARQGLTLFIFSVICDAVGSLTGFGWLLSLFRFYCIYKGMSNALNDREEPLPLIGDFAQRLS